MPHPIVGGGVVILDYQVGQVLLRIPLTFQVFADVGGHVGLAVLGMVHHRKCGKSERWKQVSEHHEMVLAVQITL